MATPLILSDEITIVRREEWGAREPTGAINKTNPGIDLVVIHHTYLPPVCNTSLACQKAMRSMQDYHQITLGWNDIGYNFAIGGDGRIYEGRGFQVVGAHTLHYNWISLGICLIGDWRGMTILLLLLLFQLNIRDILLPPPSPHLYRAKTLR